MERAAQDQLLDVIDATCPLVTKVHVEGRRYSTEGRTVILVGHAGHAEIEGTIGQIPGPVQLVSTVEDVAALIVEDQGRARLCLTTRRPSASPSFAAIYTIDALKARFPGIVGPDTRDICYATQNRQRAVRDLAQVADVILVIGSQNSSNSNRLREIGEELGVPSYLINDAAGLEPAWLQGKHAVGITAGASAPDHLVDELVDWFRRDGDVEISTLSVIGKTWVPPAGEDWQG